MSDDTPAGRPPRLRAEVSPLTGVGDALRVTAYMASPLAGDPPHLDSLLVSVVSRLTGKAAPGGFKIGRAGFCPPPGSVPIPVRREAVGGWPVALASAPVMPAPAADTVEHVAKRIGVEHAGLLAPGERKVVTTTNAWTKSYRLPLRVRRVACVAWLAVGDGRELRRLLGHVHAVGKKAADGYGRVLRWEVERIGDPPHRYWPWWVDSPAGPVLMRELPLAWGGLPGDLLGARRDFAACCDPYWRPDRFGEVVVPC